MSKALSLAILLLVGIVSISIPNATIIPTYAIEPSAEYIEEMEKENNIATVEPPDNATTEEKRIADCFKNSRTTFAVELCIAEPQLKCGPSGIPTEEQGICIKE